VVAVRDRLGQFGDATVAVVPFAILADVDRKLYQLLGAERGTNRQIWSLGSLRMYARLLRQGRRLQRPTEDIHQLGADAVVGRDGVLRYLSLPATPDARPPISELIAALD